MKVELEREFPVPAPAGAAWGLLQDIEAVAACMPGARITSREADGSYKGTITVRVGPATLSFRGELSVSEVDPSGRSLRLSGKGTDTTGGSGASMDLRASIGEAGEGSVLVGRSEVSMSGKAAAFGARMLNPVADQVLKQFAARFAAAAAARAPSGGTPEPAAETGQAPPAPDSAEAPPAAPAAAAPAPAGVPELNGLALVWAVLKDWLRGLVGRRAG